MTKKASITNGFISLLGSMPAQFGMLLTFLTAVGIPRDEEGNRISDYYLLYHSVWIMHILAGFTVFLNQHYSEKLGILKGTLNTTVMMLYTVIIILMCMEFFVKGDGESDSDDSKDKEEIKTTTNIKRRYDAQMLRGWYALEVLLAFATIISNMVFVLTRACSRIRIIGTRTTAVVHKNTDMIEEQ